MVYFHLGWKPFLETKAPAFNQKNLFVGSINVQNLTLQVFDVMKSLKTNI